jgi:hypothetical protein
VVFNDFIKDDFIPEGDGQVASGSASLPDLVVFETEGQKLQREQNECDVLDALDEYKSESGMSVEDVPTIVNIKTLKGRLITHKFNSGWVVKSVEKKKSVTDQFADKYTTTEVRILRSETYCWLLQKR